MCARCSEPRRTLLLLLLCCAPALAHGEAVAPDPDPGADRSGLRAPTAQAVDVAGDIDARSFQQPGQVDVSSWLGALRNDTSDHATLADQVLSGGKAALPELAAARRSAHEAGAQAITGKYLVFISLSMPTHALRSLFEQARERSDVVFYLRGWHPPKLLDVVRQVHELAGGADYPVPVYVDPAAFSAYGIEHVPVVLREDERGEVRRVDGEISIEGAITLIGAPESLPDYPLGNTYPIDEPDIIEYARAKAETIDWDQKIEEAKQRYLTRVSGVALPQARRDETYFVDLTVRVQQDIEGPQGVIAKAGTEVNPLAHMVVRHAYVFFDPARPAQVEVVRDWLRQHNNVVLIATQLALISEARAELSADLGQPVFPLNEILAARFQITQVPALVVADGHLLRVSVKGIDEPQSTGPQ